MEIFKEMPPRRISLVMRYHIDYSFTVDLQSYNKGNVVISVRSIKANEWHKYRELRLRALRDSPNAFGSTYEAEKTRTSDIWMSQIDAATSSGIDCVLFAEMHGVVCGLVWCKLSITDPGTADIYQMWVDPAARGLGAGYALLDAAVTWARRTDARRVRLGVTDADSQAMRLYKSYGFHQTGETWPLRDGSRLKAQTLELNFGAD
ncbi:GNAT family N-acetyltransferase [Alcaligenes sp. WGS1538]|uniref:GNAT family N-acetyltransferase n=1 Tax=Alcaligenes sp. WGS1538 TaxID=3366811 RepID=UPI00372CF6C8